jgi:hypothetical protein
VKKGSSKRSCIIPELIDILRTVAGNTPLGFADLKNPDYQWLVDVIHTLRPTHEIFTTSDLIPIFREVPDSEDTY